MSLSYHYYCPICGTSQFPTNAVCIKCRQQINPIKSLQNGDYYRNKSMDLYGDYSHWNDILVAEEVSKNPLYNPRMRESQVPKAVHDKILQDIISKNQPSSTNVPKCPTCQSTNIKKISSTKRAAHGFMFGIFSKTAFSQFECENCGYKW